MGVRDVLREGRKGLGGIRPMEKQHAQHHPIGHGPVP